ncbi:MAG: radical SAM family heme chaperone HemW [Candidatus Methylomirabilia bacterium]
MERRKPLAALATDRQDHLVVTGGRGAPSSPAEWAPHAQRVGIYLHIPFCHQRCFYCSFNTGLYQPAAMGRFLRALEREIELVGAAPWARDVAVGTVFFGGGTPSLLEADELGGILDRLRKGFTFAEDVEITAECNPESASREKLEGYRLAGVNRVGLGVQSLDDSLLRRLGRLHSSHEAHRAIEAVRAAGIKNLSVDLMYGLPGLELPAWEATVRGVFAWGPEHLSAYALTLDEGSHWASQGAADLPGEEAVTGQYWLLTALARERGYAHYEISNYCRPGSASRHNQVYWKGEEYVGLGPGGCGFLGEVRYGNVKPVERYRAMLEAGEFPIGQAEWLSLRERQGERLILGLRLAEGVPLRWLEARVAEEPTRLGPLVETWKRLGFMAVEAGRVRLTEAGFLLSDSLFVELL